MTARTYDTILEVDDVTNFNLFDVVYGDTSNSIGLVAAIDSPNIKIKLSNIEVQFAEGEVISANTAVISGTADLSNVNVFNPNTVTSTSVHASANVVAISPSPFVAEKNAFTQNPVVRLYSIYMPGNWYPPNEAGNPTGTGTGRAWPHLFPVKFGEVVGDVSDDVNYTILIGGEAYTPFPVNVSSFDQGSDGKINDLSITVFNVDGLITRLVEDPNLVGYNSKGSTANVNGELLTHIDERTVPGSGTYEQAIVDYYGKTNAPYDYVQTELTGGTWVKLKQDSRDLQGAAVEILTTFATFLDYWPEYSLIESYVPDLANVTSEITVNNNLPYRVGDNIRSSAGNVEATITSLEGHNKIYTSGLLTGTSTLDDPLYIINPEADPDSSLKDVFTVDQLENLSDYVATFGLVSWLQYFKAALPKRKYLKNTCIWTYKGEECQYPENGSDAIAGYSDDPDSADYKTANGYFTVENVSTQDATNDFCAKSFAACKLRNNEVRYGAFPGVGRTIPRG